MIVEQIYTNCLAQGAYFIESNGEVAIIDPLREIDSYIQKAEALNAQIKYIFETHFHADFVSGHITLSERTGASIVYGPMANPTYATIIAKDKQEFKIGNVTIIALHTPGHTMESTTYLLKNEDGKDHCIFSGDTLFLGDVGRPDLAQKSTNITQEELAGILYDSLRNTIMPLADDVIVYPAHGAGSACGKNMMTETVDTLGNQKQMNYALRSDMTKAEFIEEVTTGLSAPPAYFPMNVMMNKSGYANIDEIISKGNSPLSPSDFENVTNESRVIILDVRHEKEFIQGHIPQSIFIGIDGSFAPWVGAVIKDVNQPILIVGEEDRINEVITRLSRVGFDNTLGYLKGGFKAWEKEGKEIDTVRSVPTSQFETEHKTNHNPIYDVRKKGEWDTSHIKNAHHVCLSMLNEELAQFPKEDDFYVHCAGGYRSVIASSILKKRGYHNVINITEGYDAIQHSSIELVS
jgi:glyoxylase-like metal-dependent hydrolase (beta-lactamase superfamily II)/rhodanese-related sulfurtransferase